MQTMLYYFWGTPPLFWLLPCPLSLYTYLFSSFTINWDKSVLLPLDSLPWDLSPMAALISVVSSLKTLGVIVTSWISGNLAQNILLMSDWKNLVQTWSRWSGCHNYFIYYIMIPFVCHSVYFIPLTPFFRELIWKHGHFKIKHPKLQLPKDGGNLAVPNPKLYYFASQQHFYGWNANDLWDPIKWIVISQFSEVSPVELLVADNFHIKLIFPKKVSSFVGICLGTQIYKNLPSFRALKTGRKQGYCIYTNYMTRMYYFLPFPTLVDRFYQMFF